MFMFFLALAYEGAKTSKDRSRKSKLAGFNSSCSAL